MVATLIRKVQPDVTGMATNVYLCLTEFQASLGGKY